MASEAVVPGLIYHPEELPSSRAARKRYLTSAIPFLDFSVKPLFVHLQNQNLLLHDLVNSEREVNRVLSSHCNG